MFSFILLGITNYLTNVFSTLVKYNRKNKSVVMLSVLSPILSVFAFIGFLSSDNKGMSISFVVSYSLTLGLASILTSICIDKHYEKLASRYAVDDILPKELDEFLKRLDLYENGITANKFALSSELLNSEDYEYFLQLKSTVSKQLTLSREVLSTDSSLFSIKDLYSMHNTLKLGVNYLKEVTEKSLFEDDKEKINEYFDEVLATLYGVGSNFNKVIHTAHSEYKKKSKE